MKIITFKVSFDLAEYTAEVDGVGTLRLLDAIRTCGLEKSVRFYQVHSDLLSYVTISRCIIVHVGTVI